MTGDVVPTIRVSGVAPHHTRYHVSRGLQLALQRDLHIRVL